MIFIEYEEAWYKILAKKIEQYTKDSNYTLEDLSQSIFFRWSFLF